MPAPVTAIAALGQTRTGRRIATGALAVAALLAGAALTPLVAIPFAIAGSTISTPADDPVKIPVVEGDWGYPYAGAYTFGRGFGYNPVIGCGYCSIDHLGYDMAQGCGATVYAAGPGTVTHAGSLSGWGNTVTIDHGDGVLTLYGHMQWGSLRVTADQKVTAGTPLGAEGNTGRSFGCHLHFEVRHNGVPVDPAPFMAARGLPLT
jgi:murein DD-endopeptidase MepM/ murein hydrolase activator NlpD